ncbi:phosphatidylinositol transfer protein csr1 [Recurvomyces mirabilis]|uniref:Phosphatidylinositol transfer protein csr1 n=1 Tax=Recurvomyces mirabilis TaxID=574656 RepID=A0AAE0WT97_9PEZI|nr:phosphatidylinositol transfer protein csr1 [Recurvomyces mirabilis]KAK5159341.1 phosphatidylinositol transfer protein csr1 [Recurvomyces mirabilis]
MPGTEHDGDTMHQSTSGHHLGLRNNHKQLLSAHRIFCAAPPIQRLRPGRPTHSAIDPITLLATAAISAGIAYFATAYIDIEKNTDPTGAAEVADEAQVARGELEADDMAAQIPPGRPGNLTPDQEVKLREMWSATLDVFGVAHETDHTESNGTSTPSSEAAPETKKKSRMSLFGKKKNRLSTASTTSDGDTNDKYGQTKEFQQALASQTPEQLREAFWSMTKHDHPDALLLRFLRARKWDVQAALIMLVSTMQWRSTEMHVDDSIMSQGESHALSETLSSNAAEKKEGADFMAQLRMGKSFLHGTDKDGRACCYVRVKLHRQGEQSERSLERFTVYTIETARMMLRPPVDTATIVFDMTGFSMANMDYTPVKFMIKCFEANYPESLGSVLVYKSPWIFQGVWKIIKGWLDPVVAAKVHFAGDVDELSQWISKAQIPKELGGNEDWTYSYVEPIEGENKAMSDTASRDQVLAERKELVSSYEHEVSSWVAGEGSGEGRSRIAQRLAENYWRADPFLRAKSLYDRTGVIGQGGRLDFYPGAASASSGGHHDEVD